MTDFDSIHLFLGKSSKKGKISRLGGWAGNFEPYSRIFPPLHNTLRDASKKEMSYFLVSITRPGVQQCQAQGLVFYSCLGSIQDRIRM